MTRYCDLCRWTHPVIKNPATIKFQITVDMSKDFVRYQTVFGYFKTNFPELCSQHYAAALLEVQIRPNDIGNIQFSKTGFTD